MDDDEVQPVNRRDIVAALAAIHWLDDFLNGLYLGLCMWPVMACVFLFSNLCVYFSDDDDEHLWEKVTVNVEEYRTMGDPAFRWHLRLRKHVFEVGFICQGFVDCLLYLRHIALSLKEKNILQELVVELANHLIEAGIVDNGYTRHFSQCCSHIWEVPFRSARSLQVHY